MRDSTRSKTEQGVTPTAPYLWYDNSLRPVAKFRCCFAGLRNKWGFCTDLTAVAVIAKPAGFGSTSRSCLANILASAGQVLDVEALPVSVTETAILAAAEILTLGDVLLGPNVVGDVESKQIY